MQIKNELFVNFSRKSMRLHTLPKGNREESKFFLKQLFAESYVAINGIQHIHKVMIRISRMSHKRIIFDILIRGRSKLSNVSEHSTIPALFSVLFVEYWQDIRFFGSDLVCITQLIIIAARKKDPCLLMSRNPFVSVIFQVIFCMLLPGGLHFRLTQFRPVVLIGFNQVIQNVLGNFCARDRFR